MITTPLITDMTAVGKTPAQLADDIRVALTQYVEDPRVSVMVDTFQGTFGQQVRIVGATEKPASLPFRANMTLLDAMIEVGGLSEYAAGDRARLVRHDKATGTQKEYDLKIARLLKKGDTSANVRLEPGDVIIIPESMF
jgi:polysaccharide export outer membrane protein